MILVYHIHICYHLYICYDIEYDIKYNIMTSALLRSAATLSSAGCSIGSLCCFLVSATLVLLSRIRSLLILSASVMDTIRRRPLM